MAEAVVLASIGWLTQPIVSELLNKGISFLGIDIPNMAEALQDLETTILPQLELIIQEAKYSPNRASLVDCLASVKIAYLDAKAVLDDLEPKRLKRKAKGENKKLLVRLSSKPM